MGKVVRVDSDQFAGVVEFPDFLTYPQLDRVEETIEAIGKLQRPVKLDDGTEVYYIPLTKAHLLYLPILFDIVTKWDVTNIPTPPTLENFPATPKESVIPLVSQLIKALLDMRDKEVTIPNA